MLRRLFLAAVAAFSGFAAVKAPTLAGTAFLLLISLTAIGGLLRHLTRSQRLPAAPASAAAPPLAPATASLHDQAESRIGQPIHVLCPFEMRAQDRPVERWQGSQNMWIALGDQTLWFLNDATLGRLGGVWDALPRQGLHIRATDRRDSHEVEMSWPLMPRLLIGLLGGPAPERQRLLGLLAADELGVRDLLDRPPTD